MKTLKKLRDNINVCLVR